jgi:hypothetical protein
MATLLLVVGAMMGVGLVFSVVALGFIALFAGVFNLPPELGFTLVIGLSGVVTAVIVGLIAGPKRVTAWLLVTPENMFNWFLGVCGLLVMLVLLLLAESGIEGVRYASYLTMGAVLAVLLSAAIVGLLAYVTVRRSAPLCPRCRKRVRMRERLIGVPVSLEVLRNPLDAEIVATLAAGDCSPLEAAEPYASVEAWISQPALFLNLGCCDGCNGPFIMTAETHGQDSARNEVHLGEFVFHREIERRSGERFIEIAQRRGLITFGHEVRTVEAQEPAGEAGAGR